MAFRRSIVPLDLDNERDFTRFGDALKKDPGFGAVAQMMMREFFSLLRVLTAVFPDLSPRRTPTQALVQAVTTDKLFYATISARPPVLTPAAPSHHFQTLRLQDEPPPACSEDRALDTRLTRRARTSIATTARKLFAPEAFRFVKLTTSQNTGRIRSPSPNRHALRAPLSVLQTPSSSIFFLVAPDRALHLIPLAYKRFMHQAIAEGLLFPPYGSTTSSTRTTHAAPPLTSTPCSTSSPRRWLACPPTNATGSTATISSPPCAPLLTPLRSS